MEMGDLEMLIRKTVVVFAVHVVEQIEEVAVEMDDLVLLYLLVENLLKLLTNDD
jgi:hypothetical protein